MTLKLTEKQWAALSGNKPTKENKRIVIAGGYLSKVQGYLTFNDVEYYFKSLWEMNYACYLQWQFLNHFITSWKYEPKEFKFPKDAHKSGPFYYNPDFRVKNLDGSIEWHEVKGWMNAASKKKIKRFHKHFPEEGPITVIDKYWFDLAKARGYPKLIPGWMSLDVAQKKMESGEIQRKQKSAAGARKAGKSNRSKRSAKLKKSAR